jgi:hypothetical protein
MSITPSIDFEPPIRFCGVTRERVYTTDILCFEYVFVDDIEWKNRPINIPTRITVFKSYEDNGWFVNYSSTKIFVTSVDALKLAMMAAHDTMRDLVNNHYDSLCSAVHDLKSLSDELSCSIDDSDFEFEQKRFAVTLECEWVGDIDPAVAEECLVSYIEGVHPGTPTHGGFTVTSVKLKRD